MIVLARARAYRDAYRVKRMRRQPSLVEVLRERYTFEPCEMANENVYDVVTELADLMIGHPEVATVEADYGACPWVVAHDADDIMIVMVDVMQDGTLVLHEVKR